MKCLILTLSFVLNLYYGTAKVLPDNLPHPCSKSDPNYNECSLNFLRKLKTHMLNGIPELNIPSLNPLHLPVYAVNRTINDAVSISAVITDATIWGFDTMEIKSFKFDHETLSGEAEVYFPKVRVNFEYEAAGKLLGPTPLTDSGYFKGTLSGVTVNGKFSYKTIEKLGVKYFTLDDAQVTGGDIKEANVKMTSKKAENQGVADFISNFFNKNPQRTITALHPIMIETANSVAKLLIEPVLSVIPAEELIPE